MASYAINLEGKSFFADSLTDEEWAALKSSYRVGDFRMPCCASPAIPKSSIYDVPFFAHHTDECTTSPESMWHVKTKEMILRSIRELNIDAKLEQPVSGNAGRLVADVLIDLPGRRVAIEIQHSYQTLREYLKRQQKYSSLGIDNYWLLYKPRYLTLSTKICQQKLKTKFSNRVPKDAPFPSGLLQELPIAVVEHEDSGTAVRGANLHVTLEGWLRSVIKGSFHFIDDHWQVVEQQP